MVCDLRKLNKATQKDIYPMALTEDIIAAVGSKALHSIADFMKAFWQL
jgi:hypothetical protein